jgi:3-oxoacyl-[acyl-carrier protein] reductase
MLIRFDGRTAIVAGAARGIGQTIARSLANDGARVIACDLLVDDLAALAGRVDGGGEIIAAKVDVTNEASIAEVVRTAGGADILVYVAGGVRGQRPRPLEEVSADDFDAIVDANLKGAFLFIKAVAPGMRQKVRGASLPFRAAPALPRASPASRAIPPPSTDKSVWSNSSPRSLGRSASP